MTKVNTPPGGDSGDSYDLDLDEHSPEDHESLMREAVERLDQLGRRPAPESSVVGVDEAENPPVVGVTAVEENEPGTTGVARDISTLEEEMEELKERSLRTLADYENFRKRSERERANIRRYGSAELQRDFLDVVDNLERALAAAGSGDDLKVGVEMIHRQMVDMIRRHGVSEVPALDQVFDPAVHEAVVSEVDPTVIEPRIVEELQRGYLLHDRLLRPARVRVATPPPTVTETGTFKAFDLGAGATRDAGTDPGDGEEASGDGDAGDAENGKETLGG